MNSDEDYLEAIMTTERKFIQAMIHGKFSVFKNAYFMVRNDVGVYSYAGRMWRADKKCQTTEIEMESEGYSRKKCGT